MTIMSQGQPDQWCWYMWDFGWFVLRYGWDGRHTWSIHTTYGGGVIVNDSVSMTCIAGIPTGTIVGHSPNSVMCQNQSGLTFVFG